MKYLTGLHFSAKQWDPEYYDNFKIDIYNFTKLEFYTLLFNNRTVMLQYHNSSGIFNLISKETYCLIPFGIWIDYWLVAGSDEIVLICENDKTPIIQWNQNEPYFNAAYFTFGSVNNGAMGLNFLDNECIFENISSTYFSTLFPMTFRLRYNKKKLKLHLRGTGSAIVSLFSLPSNILYLKYQILRFTQ